MSCISLNVTPVAPAVLDTIPVDGASLAVEPAGGATLAMEPAGGVTLEATPFDDGMALDATPIVGCTLIIGEVCSVSGGTIVVLAASDGPLRTRDGGYLLLNPATNP